SMIRSRRRAGERETDRSRYLAGASSGLLAAASERRIDIASLLLAGLLLGMEGAAPGSRIHSPVQGAEGQGTVLTLYLGIRPGCVLDNLPRQAASLRRWHHRRRLPYPQKGGRMADPGHNIRD